MIGFRNERSSMMEREGRMEDKAKGERAWRRVATRALWALGAAVLLAAAVAAGVVAGGRILTSSQPKGQEPGRVAVAAPAAPQAPVRTGLRVDVEGIRARARPSAGVSSAKVSPARAQASSARSAATEKPRVDVAAVTAAARPQAAKVPEPGAKSELKSWTKPEAKPATAPKPEAKPGVKSEAKPEVKPEAKAEVPKAEEKGFWGRLFGR